MTWWSKARRSRTVLPVALAVFFVLVCLVQNTVVALPSITGRNQVALSLFVPVPVVSGLMLCLESRLHAPELTGTRAVGSLDAVLTTATMAASVLLALAAGQVLDAPLAATAGRNTLFLTGLMLCGRGLVGQPAVMIPVAWLSLVVFVGFRGPGDPYPWAIVPEPAGVPHAAVAALLVFLAGTAVQLRSARKMS